MIPSLIAWPVVGLVTLFWTLLIFLLYPFHFWVDPQRVMLHRLACAWGRSLVALCPGVRVRVFGEEHLAGGPAILMANHQSYTDIPVLSFLPVPFKWMADEELFRIPLLGWAMRLTGDVPVRRGDPKQGREALERAKRWLDQGISMLVFPEGTRSHTGAMGRYQTGGFRLAAETGRPIIPIVLVGTRQFLPRGSWVIRWGVKPQVHILSPIPAPPNSPGEVHRFAQQVRTEMAKVFRREWRQFRKA